MNHSNSNGSEAVPRASRSMTRLYSLDAARGLAALVVVVLHYPYVTTGGIPKGSAFFTALGPLYETGGRAVDMFFALSGFVFFWLYAGSVRNKSVSASKFAWARFSRLYPLHLVTLLIAVAQMGILMHQDPASTGPQRPYHDVRHFILQLFMAENWGLERGVSFVTAGWSVSVEILLYALFFMVCRVGFVRTWQLAVMAAVGYVISQPYLPPGDVACGVLSFFMGGVAHGLYARLKGARPASIHFLCAVTAALWVAVPTNFANAWVYHLYHAIGGPYRIAGRDFVGAGVLGLTSVSAEVVLLPATILALALWENLHGPAFRRLAWLGDVSYACYLWHGPLLIGLVSFVTASGLSRGFFASPLVMFGYIGVVVVLSWVSHRFFERPVQAWLRSMPPFFVGRPDLPADAAAIADAAGRKRISP